MNAWSSVHPVSYIFHVLLFHSISLPSIPSFHWLSHSPVPIVRSFIFSVFGISLLTLQLTCLSSPLSCMFGYHFLYSESFSLAPHFITFLSSLISIKFSPAHSHRCLVSRIYRYGGCGPFGLLVWDLRWPVSGIGYLVPSLIWGVCYGNRVWHVSGVWVWLGVGWDGSHFPGYHVSPALNTREDENIGRGGKQKKANNHKSVTLRLFQGTIHTSHLRHSSGF